MLALPERHYHLSKNCSRSEAFSPIVAGASLTPRHAAPPVFSFKTFKKKVVSPAIIKKAPFFPLFLQPSEHFIMDDRQRLKEILLKKSYRQGTFTLTSGKTSDFYIDGKQTTLSAEGGYLCGKLLFALLQKNPIPIDAVGGMTLGADPLVTAVSIASHLAAAPIPAFIVRKEAKGHGTGNYIEGLKNMPPGGTVALVEDVVTTGGTLLKVIERVQAAGFIVGLVITVVDRQEGGAEALAAAGYPLKALFTREQLLS
jgi:orotate phosphoribosyltransferase